MLASDGPVESLTPPLTPADPDLSEIVAAWPSLPKHVRATFLGIVRALGHVA